MAHPGGNERRQERGQDRGRTRKYSIGQIAELCTISRKQLRYYDENGILQPKYRDPETRYRYYTEDQIEEILLLQELRALDFPLASIGRMLGDRRLDLLHQELENRLYQMREELDAMRRQYDRSMDTLLRVTKGMAARKNPAALVTAPVVGDIKLVEFPRRVVLASRYVSYWNANTLFIARRAELFKVAEEQQIRITGPNMAIFHSGYMKQFSDLPEDQDGDLEVCLNTVEQDPTLPHCRVLGPFQAVSCICSGHYRDMRPGYIALENWAHENRRKLSGISLEEYLIGATMTNTSDDYVTRIYLPLEGSVI